MRLLTFFLVSMVSIDMVPEPESVKLWDSALEDASRLVLARIKGMSDRKVKCLDIKLKAQDQVLKALVDDQPTFDRVVGVRTMIDENHSEVMTKKYDNRLARLIQHGSDLARTPPKGSGGPSTSGTLNQSRSKPPGKQTQQGGNFNIQAKNNNPKRPKAQGPRPNVQGQNTRKGPFQQGPNHFPPPPPMQNPWGMYQMPPWPPMWFPPPMGGMFQPPMGPRAQSPRRRGPPQGGKRKRPQTPRRPRNNIQ